ncbi:outer membrane lipid asymmetry maintenance protein MlaD [Sphingomonas sp. AP4-R1]|uniref:outer membrane lipid asymmetry maintenance protein MlaD n=1 Tax=Sphingomonas sp. AP4-R1 TaxID=2735134 RepID=UPI001493AD94|nr:outer membrane lipid asymmetry maintenance protein MlaD [Sphingomonas sp. AP4-R1]QJU57946.1 outer membrane lipid asymmetry maintenance protein MlaD [Sphingomonas sp. AP4-R1]
MRGLFRENAGEAIVGLLVVILAGVFILFAWDRTGGGSHADGYKVTALFPNASGVNVGTDVRVSGLKIGSVTGQKLDPQTFQVAITIALDPAVKLPADSSAAITSEGLLGSTFVALTPGGSETPLKNGDTITDTQGAMDLMALIGQFINKPSAPAGGDQGATGAKP